MKKTTVRVILSIVFILLLILLAAYNFIKDSDKFLDASLVNCVTLGVGVIVSYVFVQRKSDIRKQKETLSAMITELQAQISSKSSYDFSGQETSEILMRVRGFNNKIELLLRYGNEFGYAQEIERVRNWCNEYRRVIDDHTIDDTLPDAKAELRRPLELMNDKLFDIIMNMYK